MDFLKISAKNRWSKLESLKTAVIQRARDCAALTIPTLLPPEGTNQTTILPTPYQSVGARGVNNLASKLLLSLFPPNTPFFKMAVSDSIMDSLESEDERNAVQEGLVKIEYAALQAFEVNDYRVSLFQALKNLITTGNTLLQLVKEKNKLKVYKLSQYCVKRDSVGNLIEIVIKESVNYQTLSQEIKDKLQANKSEFDEDKPLDLYTRVIRGDTNKFYVYQEIAEICVTDPIAEYKLEDLPFLALRWITCTNEDYGRGHVEEYLGDLRSFEGLSKAILDYSAVSSKVIFLTDPNGTTNVKKLNEAESGDFVVGREEDIAVLKVDKTNDMRIVYEQANDLKQALSFAFLMTQSIQRNAERVTAEEIRAMASELEDALGGVYSVLSQELQLPLVNLILNNLNIPKLPKDIKPIITTGLEALGRGHDLNRLRIFGATIKEIFGEQAIEYMKVGNGIKQVGIALGIDTNDLIKTEEEIAQEQQQNMLSQLAQEAGPSVAKELTKGAMNNNG